MTQPVGFTCPTVAASICAMAGGPSSVVMFQVNDTRSRQKQSSVKSAAAAFASALAGA